MLSRRRLLWGAPFGLLSLGPACSRRGSPNKALLPAVADPGQAKVVRSEAEWWSLLTPQQFYVLRQGQTDRAYSGTLYRTHDPGVFYCAGCGEPLFSSQAKYDSNTGWPSFRAPIALANVRVRGDGSPGLASGLEVVCANCQGHLGHIFDDGPPPDYLRYCINESALLFVRAG
jgi:peptide-methionine (R)-S-oxide reductase